MAAARGGDLAAGERVNSPSSHHPPEESLSDRRRPIREKDMLIPGPLHVPLRVGPASDHDIVDVDSLWCELNNPARPARGFFASLLYRPRILHGRAPEGSRHDGPGAEIEGVADRDYRPPRVSSGEPVPECHHLRTAQVPELTDKCRTTIRQGITSRSRLSTITAAPPRSSAPSARGRARPTSTTDTASASCRASPGRENALRA